MENFCGTLENHENYKSLAQHIFPHLRYMLGTAYGLLCVPLLHILDTCLVQISVMSEAAFTDLLRCQCLG